MESSAPVSRVVRASPSNWGEVLGVGRRASSLRSCRLAVERREAIFWGGGGGVDLSCVRVVFNSVVDILGVIARACAAVTSSFLCILAQAETLANAVEA